MTVVRALPAPNLLMTSTDWAGYLKYLDAIGDSHVRATYDRGALELRVPSHDHENYKTILGHLIEIALSTLERDAWPGGSMTFRREDLDKGMEPDECYWTQNAAAIGGGRTYDPASDPPPDLAIEIEVTSSVLDRIGIYRDMRIPEVWRWTRDLHLIMLLLGSDGEYTPRSASVAVPELKADELQNLVIVGREAGFLQAGRRLRAMLLGQSEGGASRGVEQPD